MLSGSGLPRLHIRQIEIASVARGRSAGLVACCARMPSQIATHSLQMNAPAPAMSRRTVLCELLQNEQRTSGLLKNRFNHMTRWRQKEP